MIQNHLHKDAAGHPKTLETRIAMVEIAQKYMDEYEAGLKSLSKDDKMQKKF